VLRLSAVELEGAPLAKPQTLWIGPVSTLWGVNDAGKSTTLVALARALARRPRGIDIAAFHVEVDRELAGEVAARAVEDLIHERTFRFRLDGREVTIGFDLAEPRHARAARAAADDRDALVEWLRLCLYAIGGASPSACEELLTRTARAPVLSFVRGPQAMDGTDGWLAWWALRDEQTVRVAPAALDVLSSILLPVPIEAPLGWEASVSNLASAAAGLADLAQRWPLGEAEGPAPSHDQLRDRSLQALVARANDRLPRFVAERYGLFLELGAPAHELNAVRLADRTVFPVDALAQGYHLWVQLALASIIEATRRLPSIVEVLDPSTMPPRGVASLGSSRRSGSHGNP
jgi:hypothetical protein